MNPKTHKSTTAINTNFTPTKSKLNMLNIINFNDRLTVNILAGRVKKNFSIVTGIVSFLLALLAFSPVHAQTEYDEYDDYYEDSYGQDPYEKYDYNYADKADKRYKRSAREEDLYNGRYKGQSDRGWAMERVYGTVSGKTSSSGFQQLSRQNNAPSPRDGYNAPTGHDKGVDANPLGDVPVSVSGFDPNEGGSTKDGRDDKAPPPPPDEPDIPVDTAIPFLIVAGIGLAGFKFYVQKKHQPAG